MNGKILFIINPTSRFMEKSETELKIARFSETYKFKFEIYYTEKLNCPSRIREEIVARKPDIAVAMGGDGTINHVASALINSETELGIIPAGSANGLAHNLGLPSDFDDAMHLIMKEDAKPLDAIFINERYYSYHLSDIGINARIVKRFEQEGSKGLTGYGKQMIKELFSKRDTFRFKISTSTINRRFKAELLAFANARSFGTGAVINPHGRMDDGEFEIVIIRPYSWWALFYLIRMFLFGRLEKHRYVKVIKTTEARIKFDRHQDLQIDGEIVKGIDTLNLKIIPAAVKIRYNSTQN